MLGKEVLTVDLFSLSAKNVQLEVFQIHGFEHVWCGLRLLRTSGLRPSQSPDLFFQWDSSYSRPSAKLAKQLGMPCGLRDNTESLTIYTR